MSKPSKTKLSSTNSALSEAKQTAQEGQQKLITFSFKYLDSQNTKFEYEGHDGTYFVGFLDRIKELSKWTREQLVTSFSKSIKGHKLEWEGSSEKRGFNFPQAHEIIELTYQFELTRNEHGRVHGFFIRNTFYIVWLDKNHQLYPGAK
jgi:hypothetical protein